MGIYPVPDTDALKVQLRARLDALPQRDAIAASDANQWIDYMANVMPHDAMWHMIRAGGVGGSEIGGLVRNYLGHRADHEFSAHDWAEAKLLRRTPAPAQGVLRRGHEMEPIHAKRFYEEFNTTRDIESYNKLSKAQGSAIWMRYSPDEMVLLERPTTFDQVDGPISLNGRLLVDYKAPTEVDAAAHIAFQYSCQLHQGAILCQEQGIEIVGAMLSQFNWATWSLKNDFVQINPDLCELIKEAGDHYWDFVMRGEIPEYIVRGRLELDTQVRDEYAEVATRIAQLNSIKTLCEKTSDDLRDKLIKGLRLDSFRVDGQAIEFKDALKLTAPASLDDEAVRAALPVEVYESLLVKETGQKYDTDAMVAHLKESGVDVKRFKKTQKVDPSRAFDALLAAGLDPEKFIAEKPRLTVAKEMKSRAEDWFSASFPPVKLPEIFTDELAAAEDSPAADAIETPAAAHERPRQ